MVDEAEDITGDARVAETRGEDGAGKLTVEVEATEEEATANLVEVLWMEAEEDLDKVEGVEGDVGTGSHMDTNSVSGTREARCLLMTIIGSTI